MALNAHLLITGIVQRTMVLVAQLATTGGIRTPLAHLADQTFLELTRELQAQGVSKKIIADMFGMALRTYHRRVRELTSSRTDVGQTIWEAVLRFVKEHEPVSAGRVFRRFVADDRELVAGALNDLAESGLVYRAGRGDTAVFRIADERDFGQEQDKHRADTNERLVWLAIYRRGPVTLTELQTELALDQRDCQAALETLLESGRVQSEVLDSGESAFRSPSFEIPLGDAPGWEAAVLDHYQAVVGALVSKLRGSERVPGDADETGGATFSLEIHPDHPHAAEARCLLSEVRAKVRDLRARVDQVNLTSRTPPTQRVVFYLGQYTQDI